MFHQVPNKMDSKLVFTGITVWCEHSSKCGDSMKTTYENYYYKFHPFSGIFYGELYCS
jgi:hypothetical protein